MGVNAIIEELKKRRARIKRMIKQIFKHELLEELDKASELYWGVLNNVIYMLGLIDGVKLGEHSKIKIFIRQLAASLSNEFIVEAFRCAEVLHANYYHGFMDRDLYKNHAEKVLRLILMLDRIFQEKLLEKIPRSDADRILKELP